MPAKRGLIVGLSAVVGGVALGAVLLMRPAPPPVAVATPSAERAVAPAPAAPSAARAGPGTTIDEALKELALIRPTRPTSAEDFTVPLIDGTRFRLSEHRGKVVLINFWATWCPPCREEMPSMERLWAKHKAAGFVLIAVSVDANTKLVQPFVSEHKLTFPIGLDSEMEVANLYGVKGLPSSFVVDPGGALAGIAVGPRVWDNAPAHALIEGLARLP